MTPEALDPAGWAATREERAELAEHGWTFRVGRGAGLWVAECRGGSPRLYERELPRLIKRVQARLHRPNDLIPPRPRKGLHDE